MIMIVHDEVFTDFICAYFSPSIVVCSVKRGPGAQEVRCKERLEKIQIQCRDPLETVRASGMPKAKGQKEEPCTCHTIILDDLICFALGPNDLLYNSIDDTTISIMNILLSSTAAIVICHLNYLSMKRSMLPGAMYRASRCSPFLRFFLHSGGERHGHAFGINVWTEKWALQFLLPLKSHTLFKRCIQISQRGSCLVRTQVSLTSISDTFPTLRHHVHWTLHCFSFCESETSRNLDVSVAVCLFLVFQPKPS